MLRILFIVAASVVSFAGTAQATHCNKEYDGVMKGLNGALESYNGAVERNDAKAACTTGNKTLAWMEKANEIIKRPGCMHEKPSRPVDLSPTRKSVGKACKLAKKTATKPETAAPKKEKAPESAPSTATQPRHATKVRASDRDKAAENYASAATYLRAARSARDVGETDAAIGAYMQAAQAYGDAGDTALQAEMLAAATELASAKDRRAAKRKK